MSAKEVVETTIDGNKVVVFSKSWCPYCRRAKALLRELLGDDGVKVLELDQREDGDAIQGYLGEKTRQRTVPNIFINKKHIGGSDDLSALNASGELVKLLAA